MASKNKDVGETLELTNETLNLARQRREEYRAAQAASAECRRVRDEAKDKPNTTQAKLAELEEACKEAREAVKVAREALIQLPKGRPTAEIAYTPEQQKAMVELVRTYNLSTAVAILRAESGPQAKLREEAGFPEALTVSAITVRKFVSMDPNPPELKRGRRKADEGTVPVAKSKKGKDKKPAEKAEKKAEKGKGKGKASKKKKASKKTAVTAVETPKEPVQPEPAPEPVIPPEVPAVA